MGTDLGALASAVAPVAGSQIAFVAAPGEAAKIALRSTGPFPYPVLPSNGLPEKTVRSSRSTRWLLRSILSRPSRLRRKRFITPRTPPRSQSRRRAGRSARR